MPIGGIIILEAVMDRITVAEHAGFCFGVTKAVESAYMQLRKAAEDGVGLFSLGQIIHNKTVTDELAASGLKTVSSIEEVPQGARLLIRAHGEPDMTYKKAEEKGIEVIDATCPLVSRIHDIARKAGENGRALIVVGDSRHPEIRGILGSTKGVAYAVQSPQEALETAEKLSGKEVTVVAQTTITRELFDSCIGAIKTAIPGAKIVNTICRATKDRQDAAARLAAQSDLMVVIGDQSSSNSQKLFEICKKHCKNTIFVEKSDIIPLQHFQNYCKIGVAASASAPERIIKEVVTKMSEVFTKNPQNEEVNDMSAYMDQIEKSLKLPGRNEVVEGTVVLVTKDHIVVNLGFCDPVSCADLMRW